MDSPADLLAGGAGSAPVERADAARNRAKVLTAAAELFAARDPRTVTMDDIAKAAGVGRGTLYRRYPDTHSIAVALLDEHERALQEQLVRGAPPLGPGASPAERLAAFYAAMVELLDTHSGLVLGAETGGARFTTGAYGFWFAHVRALLRAADVPDPDAMVDPLLAPLAAEVYQQQRARGLAPAQIAGALRQLAHALLGR
ncbi:TetR/AcrR family transcriptional regulator [Nocardia cyriacigeorgica]|uniref:TetR/AcrR family transcriptional regulator n=1 Tax=Nocardia cyriacigeorgica TaxID=135487 RepID=UPI0018948A08|nr:TetR/AcrR family transcriptional regulator [Nocardia cyriacigeorgica]MBF6438233.1 TetR/AcrR family transcriptional regulator [Nocardia cyriacigeorgica]MBF6453769.1 TetR/AcrR family transcriptional regulator [Nocardia cyriacigeorgica]MBF6478149.1 TetR/AcrR family transcriptional regulator [Nocardia cyriacigeorgica]MBF6550937.1 TetR/AcrR family transcriptional regulator [Nocardia cyriacigeorgica]